jgi:hypothetical protein
MSLRLGIASISSSFTLGASKVFGAVVSDLKEEDKEGENQSDNEGSKDGEVPDDGVSSVAGFSLFAVSAVLY